MNFRKKLVEFIRTQANPPDKFSHQARLHRLAVELAEGASFDDEILFAAAWLHDLGVFIGHRPEAPTELAFWDHVAYTVDKTPDILRDCDFPEAKIPAVISAIKAHLPGSEPHTFEEVLLRDADILEQLGAVGILRTVSKVGRDTRFTRFDDALRVLENNISSLPAKLRLESSKRLAEPRIQLVKSFVGAAHAEAAGIRW